MRVSLIRLALFAGLLAGNPVVFALEIEPGIGAGLLYTDNAKLEAKNEDDDLVVVGYLGAKISEGEGPFLFNASTSLIYTNYTENTFSDQYYVNLAALAEWGMIRDRLDWRAEDFYTQQRVNSLDADTPKNSEDTNVFSFGPTVYFPISGRQQVTLRPLFQDFYYEKSDTDNRQYSLNADWSYKLNRITTTGLDGRVTTVDYDDEDKNPNYTSTAIHAFLAGSLPRSEYTLDAGATNINRDKFENQSGFSGSLTWLYRMTGHSIARAFLSTDLTDSSQGLLKSEQNPDDGDFDNEQISGDVLRNTTARLLFRREDTTFNADVWGEYRDLDYKESPNDRDVREFGTRLDYRVTPLVTTGVNGRYNRTKEKDTGRRDKRYIIGADIAYQLSSKLRARFDVRYQNKDSNESNEEYKEFSAFVSLVYGYADVGRPK
jgi:hypothetical protein